LLLVVQLLLVIQLRRIVRSNLSLVRMPLLATLAKQICWSKRSDRHHVHGHLTSWP